MLACLPQRIKRRGGNCFGPRYSPRLTRSLTPFKRKKRLKTIEEGNTLKLSAKDSKAFIDAIENPPEPNEYLKNAIKLYLESDLNAENGTAVQKT